MPLSYTIYPKYPLCCVLSALVWIPPGLWSEAEKCRTHFWWESGTPDIVLWLRQTHYDIAKKKKKMAQQSIWRKRGSLNSECSQRLSRHRAQPSEQPTAKNGSGRKWAFLFHSQRASACQNGKMRTKCSSLSGVVSTFPFHWLTNKNTGKKLISTSTHDSILTLGLVLIQGMFDMPDDT